MAPRYYGYFPGGLLLHERVWRAEKFGHGVLAAPYGVFYCRGAVFSILWE